MLLDRFHAYKASGLAGIAPYDRAGGTIADPAGELLKASNAAVYLQKYLPALQQELTVYPSPVVPGLEQNFHWLQYDIDGTPTFALMHEMAASAGAARAAVQRQYYVSTGYNAEQAIAGFLPVKSGTIVVYTNHTFTDRVAGFGGAAKRSIGRRVTSTKLEQIFAAARTKVSEPRRGQ